MSEPLDMAVALDPTRSVVVEACAGSGKTWLLVSRMIRLLLDGAKPSELLAITFTRKAAQEMTDRLQEWLQLLALGDDAEVREFLRMREIAEDETDTLLPRARGLLEAVLTAQPGPTITTFHGWFLDLLKRAPLEAGLPWGAPLLENESLLRREVWEQLTAKWAAQPDSPHGQALLALLDEPGDANLKKLLFRFLSRRAEWWAYTEGQTDPAGYALDILRKQLTYDPKADPVSAFWADELMVQRVIRVGHALEKGTETEQSRGADILRSPSLAAEAAHEVLMTKLMTAGKRRKTQATRPMQKNLGAALDDYLRDLDALETELENIAAHQTEIRIWNLNRHGLPLGHDFIQAYQTAKQRQGAIDFNDAEWLACKLLQNDDFAPALNLKLDARYRHLLLDEFQDTNPLQWQALSTWLGEARAADADMTVFMVGDPKQAIYRFRRGEARVFDAAADFLRQKFQAIRLANNQTRRLAPEVVKSLNPVFASEPWFEPHDHAAENETLPGALRCVPVAAENSREESRVSPALRDPLTTPLEEAEDKAIHLEAAAFARVLRSEVLDRWEVRSKAGSHAAKPGDVLALVRKRTHLKVYEQALEAAGVPFITSRRGGLLHALEAQDLVALLETLLMPHANLKLAHALKCPVFDCGDDALLRLFKPDGPPGWDTLCTLASVPDCPAVLARAARLLTGWRAHVGTLPVHDLLDRIYFEGDVEARYAAAAPEAMRPVVSANLRAFMQLALTQDGGRYPSLAGFIRELKTLVNDVDAAPDEGIAADGENAVRLLTIHGAKGLESPIVWLLGGADHDNGNSYDVLSPWPPTHARPEHFSLFGKKEDRGAFREAWFAEEEKQDLREDANLLYVALTRAQQALIVSGNGERTKSTGKMKCAWLDRVSAAWENVSLPASLPHAPDVRKDALPNQTLPTLPILDIGQRLAARPQSREALLGEFFHACLEHYAPPGNARDLPSLALQIGLDSNERTRAETQAKALLAQPGLARFFDPSHYLAARNELAFINQAGEVGRIDRLVEFEGEIWVLDYKTGEADILLEPAQLIARHRGQLEEYARAASALWPGKLVHAALVLVSGELISL